MKKIIRKIYETIPYKREFFFLLKKVWRPQESIYKHLHFKGIITIPVEPKASFKIMHYGFQIENEIFWAGLTAGWEKNSIKLWIELSKNANVIFDVGANTGLYALISKSLTPKSKVYAFEPVKRVYDKLVENTFLNKYDVECFSYAASNQNGKAIIYDTLTEHVYSVTVNKNLSSDDVQTIKTEIETITLDTVIERYQINTIDLIKIDVETHEPEVLEGFKKYLPVFKPIILIEILTDEIGQKVESHVKELGYLYFNIDEKGCIRKVNNITKSDYYNYLLCNEKTAKELKLL